MYNLDYLFLEEYKRLDKLCREMYLSEKGVTSYINDMKSISSSQSGCVQNWDADFKKLIELRHIRTQLAHDVGTLNSNICSKADVLWLQEFYNRIMSQTDPLSLCNKNKYSSICEDDNQNFISKSTTLESRQQPKIGCFASIVIFILFAIFTSVLIFLFLLNHLN